jgi:hypothetical protein
MQRRQNPPAGRGLGSEVLVVLDGHLMREALLVPLGVVEEEEKWVGHNRPPRRPALGRQRAAEFRPFGSDTPDQLDGACVALNGVFARVSHEPKLRRLTADRLRDASSPNALFMRPRCSFSADHPGQPRRRVPPPSTTASARLDGCAGPYSGENRRRPGWADAPSVLGEERPRSGGRVPQSRIFAFAH